jgi:colanic acid biosynthesis glycosyl transferase WcaI
MPFYPEWRIWPRYRGRPWQREHIDGVDILRSWHFVRPNPSTATRIAHEASLSLFALPNLIRVLRGAREVYVVTPALSYAFLGSVIAALLRVRRVLVVKDVMPDAAIELGMMRNRLVIEASRALARWTYRLANEIHTLGEGMRRRIARLAGDSGKIRIVVDTVDPEELMPVPRSDNEFRRRHVPEGTFAVLHTGNMGQKQDLDLILDAAAALRSDPSFRFYVFGDGAAKARFLARKRKLGLGNVSHFPLQDRWLLRHMLCGADVVLVSQVPEVVDIVVPSKLITSMAAGAMVVVAAARMSEAARLVRECRGGITIPASDDHALVTVLRRVRDREIDTAAFRRRAREFAVRTFGREAVYGPIATRILAGTTGNVAEGGERLQPAADV